MESIDVVASASTRTRILAYLGELKRGEYIPVKKLIYDLSLRFTTAKNVLAALEEEWLVDKKIETTRGTIALFRISPTAVSCVRTVGVAGMNQTQEQRFVPYVPPEWSASYGRHPYGL